MALSRTAIVQGLQKILGAQNVITDERELQQSSIDRLRLYEDVHGVFTQPLPAAVAMARSTRHVADVLKFANEHRINVVARTGRTATEGGLETAVPDSIVLDGSGLDRVVKIDTYNMQATVQCGVPLQVLEDLVRRQACTTGHSPQSKPIAQLGGLVATRSIGQFSTLYGGIEDMVVGLEAVFPGGEVARIKNVPFPESGRGCGDVLLTDGEPRGYRQSGGRQVPVFNELQVLSPSALSTFVTTLTAPDAEALTALEELARAEGLSVEDWSTVRALCACCSEGSPEAHNHEEAPASWPNSRTVGVAAPSDDHVHRLLTAWTAAGPDRSAVDVECQLDRCPSTPKPAA